MKDQPEGKLHPIESKYMAGAAVVGFLLALLLTGGRRQSRTAAHHQKDGVFGYSVLDRLPIDLTP